MKVRGFFELVRVFLTPSAAADSLAGFALASTFSDSAPAWHLVPLVCTSSILLYWVGMATNDLFDLRKDREFAPEKPLVAGRVSVLSAVVAAIVLTVAALSLGFVVGAIVPASFVLFASLAYNAGLKRIPILGNLVMGSCRSGNFLLGVAATDAVSTIADLGEFALPAAIIGAYVAGITAVSVLEDREYQPTFFHVLATPMLLVPLGLGILAADSSPGWVNTVLLLWLLIRTQRLAASRKLPGHPAAIYVRGSLAGLYFVDAGLIWAFHPFESTPWIAPAAIYGLFLLSLIWKSYWLRAGRQDT